MLNIGLTIFAQGLELKSVLSCAGVDGTCQHGTRVDYILGSPKLPFDFVPGSYSVVSSRGTSNHDLALVDLQPHCFLWVSASVGKDCRVVLLQYPEAHMKWWIFVASPRRKASSILFCICSYWIWHLEWQLLDLAGGVFKDADPKPNASFFELGHFSPKVHHLSGIFISPAKPSQVMWWSDDRYILRGNAS